MSLIPPIAEPRGDSAVYHSFRVRFWPYFSLMVGSSIPTIVIALWLAAPDFLGQRHAWQHVIQMSAVVLVFLFAFSWSLVLCYRYKLGRHDVRGFTFWGLPKQIEWEHIREVRPSSLGKMGYLRIFDDRGGVPIWWPLFVVNPEQMERSLREFAPPDNPVRRYFQEKRAG